MHRTARRLVSSVFPSDAFAFDLSSGWIKTWEMLEIAAYISRGGRQSRGPAVVTMATASGSEKTRYLVRSRANWTFRDTSSRCSPETESRTKDARTSCRPSPPCSHTCHSYTGRDLRREEEGRGQSRGEWDKRRKMWREKAVSKRAASWSFLSSIKKYCAPFFLY